MYQTMFNKGMVATLEPAVYFTAARHRAIVNNIANVSTPGYQMLDAPVEEFREAFQRALEARDERRVPVFDFQGSDRIVPRSGGGLAVTPREFPREAGILKHDENNLFLEREMAKLARNAGLHNTLLELLNHQFGMLERAIRERVG
jgi:flagellar basal-body rod protein FlgB